MPDWVGAMRWLVIGGVTLLVAALLPWAILASKRSLKNGRFKGASIGFAMAFAAIFDPRQAAAMEHIRQRKELGDIEDGEGGDTLA